MSLLTCLSIFRGVDRDPKYSSAQKERLRGKILDAVKNYETDSTLISAEYAKDVDTMKWVFGRATGKQLDLDANPITFADVRKFNSMIKTFSKDVGKKNKGWLNMVKVPKAIMRKFPELAKFQEDLAHESSFYRSAQIANNQRIDTIVNGWTNLAKTKGSDIKKLQKLEAELATEREKPYQEQDVRKLNEIQKKFQVFLEDGSQAVFVDFNALMNGKDVESLAKNADGSQRYNAKEMTTWREMNKSVKGIRSDGVRILTSGINRLMATAKMLEKRNLGPRNLESVIRDAADMIKNLEFQQRVDTEAAPNKDMKAFDKMETILGFSRESFKGMEPRKYMPLYVIGATKLLRQIDTAMRDNNNSGKDIREILHDDLSSFRKGTTRIMSRGNISLGRYTIDPAYFLKKYMHDITTFNFTTHLENSYWQQAGKVLDLNHKAKADKNKEIMELSESLIKQMNEIKNSLVHVDPSHDAMVNDISRLLTAVTYTRLMGYNFRSAARNATQRLYEFVEFGYQGRKQANTWLKSSAVNRGIMEEQAKRFGLSWYVNAGAGILGKSKSIPLEQATRGAIDSGSSSVKGYEQNHLGEMVRKDPTRSVQEFTRKTADVAGRLAGTTGFAHRVVEDWNRAGTFKIAFGLNYTNLDKAPKQWKINEFNRGRKKQVLEPSDKQLAKWVADTSGRMAYNMTSDLHFEYAKWAKAKPFKGPGGQVVGQFMHYRMSMFDLMMKWFKDGMRSVKAGDLRSEEAFKMYRLGMLQSSVWTIGTAFNVNLGSLVQNDVVETGTRIYRMYSADRSTPEGKKKFEDASFGSGWLGVLGGPNIVWGAQVGESLGFYNMGDNSYIKNHRILEGNENYKKEERFKSLALINAQLARFTQYTYPLIVKRGLWDAAKLELGFFGNTKPRNYLIDRIRMSGVSANTRKTFSIDQWKRGHKGMTASQMRDVTGSIDYIQGKATPSQILSKRKKPRDKSGIPKPFRKDVMDSLSFLETLN